MDFNFKNIASLMFFVISFLFAMYLFSIAKKKRISNILLAFFLILQGIDGASQYLYYTVFPYSGTAGMLISQFVLFKAPLFYLYVLSILYSNFKLKPAHLLHAIPFIFEVVSYIPIYYILPQNQQYELLLSDKLIDYIQIHISYIVLHVQAFVYFIAIYYYLRKYKKLLLENYTDTDLFDYKWLFQLTTILTSVFVIASIKNIFMFLRSNIIYTYTLNITIIIALFSICWIVFKALNSPKIFTGIDSNLKTVVELIKTSTRENYDLTKQRIYSDSDKVRIEKLKNFLIESELYLNSELTLNELANQLNIPAKELSILINHKLNKHFFDLINEYRIEKAMQILQNPKESHLTILEILYAVGFNSKSSFNTAFKKHTGLTPTEYRQKLLESVA